MLLWLMNDEMEGIQEKAIVAYSRRTSNMNLGNDESYKILIQDSRYPGRDSNPATSY
jgi:hypothetical protein